MATCMETAVRQRLERAAYSLPLRIAEPLALNVRTEVRISFSRFFKNVILEGRKQKRIWISMCSQPLWGREEDHNCPDFDWSTSLEMQLWYHLVQAGAGRTGSAIFLSCFCAGIFFFSLVGFQPYQSSRGIPMAYGNARRVRNIQTGESWAPARCRCLWKATWGQI